MAYNHRNIIVGAADLYLGDTAGQELPDFDGLQNGDSIREAFKKLVPEDPGPPVVPAHYVDVDGWKHLGLTTGGVEVTYAPDFGEVEVDQYLDTAYMYKQRQTVTVGTTLAEATLRNLMFAWGQSEETLDEDGDGIPGEEERLVIHGGSLGAEPEERALAFVGNAPRTGGSRKERLYYLERVLSVESSAHSLSRSDATTIPVSLRCLPGDTDTSGEVTYGYIVQRTLTV